MNTKNPYRGKIEKPVVTRLSAERIKQLEAQAIKEHEAELAKQEEEAVLAYHKAELKRKGDPAQEQMFIRIYLPPHALDIRLDNTVYQNGWQGNVSRDKYMTLQDIMARAWDHQEVEVEGRKRSNQMRRPRNIVIGEEMAGMSVGAINRSY